MTLCLPAGRCSLPSSPVTGGLSALPSVTRAGQQPLKTPVSQAGGLRAYISVRREGAERRARHVTSRCCFSCGGVPPAAGVAVLLPRSTGPATHSRAPLTSATSTPLASE